MVKYKKGDKLLCIEDCVTNYGVLFKRGNLYEVSNGHVQYFNDNRRNLRILNAELNHTFVAMWEDEANKHFINLSSRKEKLKRLQNV